jgi:hypothetical protein
MTRERELFWSAVDEALDARRDPRSEMQVQQWLAEDPQDREELARLLRRLDAIAISTQPARRVLLPMIAAAAAIVLVVQPWTRTATHASSPRSPSRIVSFSIEVTRESGEEITTTLSQPDHFERTEVTRLGATSIVSSFESRQP